MKRIAIFLIQIYKMFFSPLLSVIFGTIFICRYQKHCSDYTIMMIEKYGIIQGGYRGLKRLLSCNPFQKTL